LGCPIVTSGDSNALFPNYFGEDLLVLLTTLLWNIQPLQLGLAEHYKMEISCRIDLQTHIGARLITL